MKELVHFCIKTEGIYELHIKNNGIGDFFVLIIKKLVNFCIQMVTFCIKNEEIGEFSC